jgi:hypothetical protein
MLKIVESVCQNPIRFFPDPKVKFKTGLIVQLTEINQNPSVTISDGTRPFGIVGEMQIQTYGLIPIWFETMIFRTDVYEKKEGKYDSGTPLYVSKRGMLTALKSFEDAHIVGYVVAVSQSSKSTLEVNWI